MNQPLSVTCHGMAWNLYSVEFVSPDGRFEPYEVDPEGQP